MKHNITLWVIAGMGLSLPAAIGAERPATEEVQRMIDSGGLTLRAIGALSLIGLGLFIERLWTCYFGATWPYRKALRAAKLRVRSDTDLARLNDVLSRSGGMAPELLRLAALHGAKSRDRRRNLLENALRVDLMPRLLDYMEAMSLIIRLGPMLGLFGTVWGMIGAFAIIASQTSVKPEQLADNIGLALSTTAAGLLVAIPMLIFQSILLALFRSTENELRAVIGLATRT